jgi:hypothetical protein
MFTTLDTTSDYRESSADIPERWETTGKTVDSLERQTSSNITGWQPLCEVKSAASSNKEEYPQGNPRGGENEEPKMTGTQMMKPAIHNDMAVVCSCGKICKNTRGLKIHQSRMKCLAQADAQKRPVLRADKTEESLVLESNHSDHAHHSEAQNVEPVNPQQHQEGLMENKVPPNHQPGEGHVKQRIKWPASNAEKEYNQFDNDLDKILETTLIGNVERKIQTFTRLIYAVGKERFGTIKEGREKRKPEPSRQELQKGKLRKELKQLKSLWRNAKEEEKLGLSELRELVRMKLINVCKAERERLKRRNMRRSRDEFISNPYKYTTRILGKAKSGSLETPVNEVEKYLAGVHSDSQRDEPLQGSEAFYQPEEQTVGFDMSEIKWKEVQQVVQKARAGSAPGISGITYQVYKKCPKLLRRLWKLMNVIWKNEVIPEEWTKAEGCFAPKEENSKDITQFRTISLLSVEGKIYFSILAQRLTSYLLNNEYLDTAVQKGGVPGFSGCLEHTAILSELIQEAREKKGDLAVIWLDLANAYGSIPHQLIVHALSQYKVPQKVQDIIKQYLDKLELRFRVGRNVTSWQRLGKGIITGCTISVTLFVGALNMIIKAAETQCRGPVMRSGVRQKPIKAYMDDMTLTTQAPQGARWILNELDRLLNLARMEFKAKKCRSLVIVKGKIKDMHYKIQSDIMPTIYEEPIKYLGKWYNSSLKDISNVKNVCIQLKEYMKKIEKCTIPGRFKAWMFHHGVIPKMRWPLMMYEMPITQIENMEKICSRHLRKWLGVPPCFTDVGLYGKENMVQLPLKSLVEEYKVVKVQAQVTLQQSKDKTVREAGVTLRSGRKWSVKESAIEAEAKAKHKEIVGTTALGRRGLDVTNTKRWSKADNKERRAMIQKEVRESEEEKRKARAVGMVKQGAWTRWEGITPKKIKWADMVKVEPLNLQFTLKSVYDLLPTPVNLKVWKKQDNDMCYLCQKRGTLQHILSGCNTALTQGRYKWRHDKILREIATIIDQERLKKRPVKDRNIQYINFVKSGTVAPSSGYFKQDGLLGSAKDWQMLADLDKQLKFPEVILSTNLRPDIVLWTTARKFLVIIELTVPWEDRMEIANELKSTKYNDLVKDCENKGWKVWSIPIEVGARGFVGRSVWKMCKILGINGRVKELLVKTVIKAAERSSSWLWIKREALEWSPS